MTLGGVVLLPIGILAEGTALLKSPGFAGGFRGSTVIFGNSLFPGAGSPQTSPFKCVRGIDESGTRNRGFGRLRGPGRNPHLGPW